LSTGFNGHPFNQSAFGADIPGCLEVERTGTYTFTWTSDDCSVLWIDGNLAVDKGGSHPPVTRAKDVTLTAGTHSFEVHFFEGFGRLRGVDLSLPRDVTYACGKDCEGKH
jgi:hypothetical protein